MVIDNSIQTIFKIGCVYGGSTNQIRSNALIGEPG